MNEVDLTDRVDPAVRAHVRPAPRFPEAVWAGGEVRLRLWAEQAADVARMLGIGVGLPLGVELSGFGVRASVPAEVDGVAALQMSERYALRFATMLEKVG
ncbi:hypothetical protein ACIQCG_41245 [Streptomyces noursei]|uniref:hypothetical protein n=1 Tax=Streptomyces noursei TaxID=1971 RepID=UPI0033E602F4